MGAITSDRAAPARLWPSLLRWTTPESAFCHQGSCRFLAATAELSPLDLAVPPNGNIVVSSEHPFGLTDAVTSVREYGAADGQLIRVFPTGGSAEFRRPRGLRFGPDGILYCVARDEVMAFDFAAGRCLGAVVRYPRLNGQALVFFP
jgi:hypothetical protein